MRGFAPLLVAALLVSGAGCGPQVIREVVYDSEDVKVQLRHTVEDDAKLPLGYDQPVTIADVRVAHILASLTYSGEKHGPRPAISNQHLYDLAEGIAKALQDAGPDDEIVAWTISKERRLVLFTEMRTTALKLHAKDDQLLISFYSIDRHVEREERREPIEPPLELPTTDPPFTLDPGKAQARVGPRTLSIDWRDPRYRKPTGLRAQDGRLSRRTVIMQQDTLDEEIEAEIQKDSSDLAIPPEVTDAQMRAFDQLDGARRAGLVTEAEFQRRRRLILQGRLAEAGYAPEPE
jgi:hypothetical protein